MSGRLLAAFKPIRLPEALLVGVFWLLLVLSFLTALDLYHTQRALAECRTMRAIVEEPQ